MTQVQMDKEDVDGATVLRIRGRLDASSSPQIEKKIFEIIDKGSSKVVLNFEKVDYLSSAGMRLLLATLKKIKSLQGALQVCCVKDAVFDVIRMAGFDHILSIVADEKAAVAKASGKK